MERRRVLVVDDKEDAVAALAAVLSVNGYSVLTAKDGEEALAAACAEKPDAVLLDLGLPLLSGHDVCARIRTEPWGRGVLIIAVTGWSREEDRARARVAGFDYYLLKPVEFDTLDTLLRGVERRTRREV